MLLLITWFILYYLSKNRTPFNSEFIVQLYKCVLAHHIITIIRVFCIYFQKVCLQHPLWILFSAIRYNYNFQWKWQIFTPSSISAHTYDHIDACMASAGKGNTHHSVPVDGSLQIALLISFQRSEKSKNIHNPMLIWREGQNGKSMKTFQLPMDITFLCAKQCVYARTLHWFINNSWDESCNCFL